MIKLYFISVLVMTTNTPSLGWLQWTESYSDKKICEDTIRKNHELISINVKGYLGKKFMNIRELRCLTYNEALDFNTGLGH